MAHLHAQDELDRYVALDFSIDMLEMAKNNVEKWFDGRVKFEGYQLDMAHERFSNITAQNYLQRSDNGINLVLLLGGTPTNLRATRDVFRTVCESMNPGDLFIYTDKLTDPDKTPEWLEYSYDTKPEKPEVLNRHRFVLDKLNIKDTYYQAELGFDKVTKQKYSRAKLKFALTVKFEFSDGERTVKLEKGSTITLWRCLEYNSSQLHNLLEDSGFYVLHSSQSEDRGYILTIAEVQRS